jgi:hypothetical protein
MRCLTSSWVEILRQTLKISLIASYFSKEAISLINNELLKEEDGGYFNLTQRQKGVLLMSMMEAIHNLDTFRTIIEYREELCQELSKEFDEAISKHNESKLDV